MSSTYYQTSAKPRGRRETGVSENPTRSRAPSESSNLTKKISRTSDENIQSRSTNSRPNSPATFMQRHRTLDRASLMETILPKSTSSTSLKSNKGNVVPEADLPLIIPSSNPPMSTPTSPLLTASKIESRERRRSLHSKTSSKSMKDTSYTEIGRYTVAPTGVITSTSDAGQRKQSKTDEPTQVTHDSNLRAGLQPSVTDASEDNTPIPTPSPESSRTPFEFGKIVRPGSHSSQKQSPPAQQSELLPQPVQQPPPAWYSDTSSQTWYSTASPPQSPVTAQYGGFQVPGQVQYPYDFSYGYAPHMTGGGYQAYATPYYPPPFSPPAEVGPPPPAAERQPSRSGSGDENNDLMTRIQSVLPDLSRLLEQYREGQALPAPTETPASRLPTNNSEELITLQQELDATKKEYEIVIRKLVDENCTLKNEAEDRQRRSRSLEGDSRNSRKLKSEFEALQAQHQNLASSVDSIRLSKEELIAEKLGVEKHVELLKKDKHILKDSHHRIIADLKTQHMEALISKDSEHQKAIAEHKSLMNKVQLDLASLINKHTATKRELESVCLSEAAYKATAEAKSKELEAAKLHHGQYCDKLKSDHQRALESLKQEHKSQRLRHENEIKKYIAELETFRTREKGWESESRALQADVQTHKAALATEREAHANLKKIQEEQTKKTTDLAKAMTSWRKKHAELQQENKNLDGVLQALGFSSTAAETNPEPQQPEPATDLQEPARFSEEPTVATEDSEKVKQESVADPSEKTGAPVQELKQDPPGAEMPSPKELVISSEHAKATESAIAGEEVTSPQIVSQQLPAGGKDNPKGTSASSQSETGTKEDVRATQAPPQAAGGSITFRPIHYYQVPGQYQ